MKKGLIIAGLVISTLLNASSVDEIKDFFVKDQVNWNYDAKKISGKFVEDMMKAKDKKATKEKLFQNLVTPGSFLANNFKLGTKYNTKQLPRQFRIYGDKDAGQYLYENEYYVIKLVSFYNENDPVFKSFIKRENNLLKKFGDFRNANDNWLKSMSVIVNQYTGVDDFVAFLQRNKLDVDKYTYFEVRKFKEKNKDLFLDENGKEYISGSIDEILKFPMKDGMGHIYNINTVVMSGDEYERLKKYMDKYKDYMKYPMLRKIDALFNIHKGRRGLIYQLNVIGKNVGFNYNSLKPVSPDQAIKNLEQRDEEFKFFIK